MVSFRGQKKPGPSTDRCPLGFNSKFPTSIPTPFICGVLHPGTLSVFCKCEFTRYVLSFISYFSSFSKFTTKSVIMMFR